MTIGCLVPPRFEYRPARRVPVTADRILAEGVNRGNHGHRSPSSKETAVTLSLDGRLPVFPGGERVPAGGLHALPEDLGHQHEVDPGARSCDAMTDPVQGASVPTGMPLSPEILEADIRTSIEALIRLDELLRSRPRDLVFFVGAGVSAGGTTAMPQAPELLFSLATAGTRAEQPSRFAAVGRDHLLVPPAGGLGNWA